MDDRERCLEPCTPFVDWLSGRPSDQVEVMASAAVGLIEGVHALGICHRDLHRANLVIGGDGRPLVVDLELAHEVDPTGPCFDFYGPGTGIPVAEQHRALDRVAFEVYVENGVWWDSPAEGLGRIFGPLASCLARREATTD